MGGTIVLLIVPATVGPYFWLWLASWGFSVTGVNLLAVRWRRRRR